MEVALVFELRELQKLSPIQRDRTFYVSMDFEFPLLQRNLRPNTEIQHGKIVHLPLTRGKAVRRARQWPIFAGHFARPAFFGADVSVLHFGMITHSKVLTSLKFRARLPSETYCRTITAMPEDGEYLKGQLLLDGGQLRGSFFQRTVVLICQHDAEGAFGLVLNRATGSNVGDMIVADLPEQLKGSPLYLGGPVQPSALSFLHTDAFLPDANVLPNLNLGHSLDSLLEVGESYSPTRKIRLFAGYAGWIPGQLEEEMKRKAWLTHPASLELVFDSDPEKLWQSILSRKGWKYKLLSQMPEDLSLN